MSRLGFRKVAVYFGEACLGKLDTVQVGGENFQFPNNEIRLHGVSATSERCHPLAVLRTISAPVRCKLEPSFNSTTDQSQLIKLHAACFDERKTAVVIVNNEELHLVAMPSKLKYKFPCFWCYSVPIGLYHSCSQMLNLRCLAIVFDLDETLVVAKTMKSFGDRIEALRGQIARESNPIRSSGMTAEMNRYIEDRSLLKQYVESDSVVDSGKFHEAKLEYTTRGFRRPVIRLLEKNVVLTRINPENRDTSVLVRLRPGWEGLRSYLITARFEVYVCTMAEKEYALEMWRLLDPNAGLISLDQRMNRVVSVRDGSKKSLLNVFQKGDCHSKMAMVIDDRVDVWDDRDEPRVHAVPAFTPYYAPRAETAHAHVPVLGEEVRTVAFNVRERFFKEFDESLLHKISEIRYEDEVASFPASLDVANYLPNGSHQRLHSVNSKQPNVFKKPRLVGSQNQLTDASDQRLHSMNSQQPNVFKKPRLVGSQNQLPANTINDDQHRTEETSNHIPAVTIHALHELGRKCNSKVEFKPFARASDYLFEIWCGGNKVGMGTGKTMRDAQLQAADKALRTLADKVISHNLKPTLNIIWTHIGYLAPHPLIGC